MKLLITDIDGSLLPFGHMELSSTLVDFFHTLPTQGVMVTFATGKPFTRALPLANILGITTPLICANGALIKDPVTNQTLFREPIQPRLVQEIIRLFAADPRCQLYPETEEGLFFVDNPAIPKGSWRHDRAGWIIPPTYVLASDSLTDMAHAPHKIAVSTIPADREAIEALLQDHFSDTLNIFHPKPDIIDITSKAVDKGTAALWLIERLHLRKEDVVIIGDEMNDLPLMAVAGKRLIRDHAPEALLKQADLVVGGGDEALILALKQVLDLA